MRQDEWWHWSRITCTFNRTPAIFYLLFLLVLALPRVSGTSVLNDTVVSSNSTELQDDTDLLGTILRHSRLETTTRQAQKDLINAIKPVKVTDKEWKRLTTSRGPLITQVAFDTGAKFSPTKAYITSSSYEKYLDDLEEKCRKANDDNIADIPLDNLNNQYFVWEEYQFNKALLHTLFPETSQGDHTRFLSSTNVRGHIRLGNELKSQCQIVEQQKDDWSYMVDEKTQFEDYLINRIFQPRFVGLDAQAIIDEIEGYSEYDHERRSGNLTSSFNETQSRGKRNVQMSRKQMEQEARRKVREFKSKRRV